MLNLIRNSGNLIQQIPIQMIHDSFFDQCYFLVTVKQRTISSKGGKKATVTLLSMSDSCSRCVPCARMVQYHFHSSSAASRSWDVCTAALSFYITL